MSTTSRRSIHTDEAPKAIGPYAQAVLAQGLVFCSGQIALDPATGQVITGDVREQTVRVLENLTAVLRAAGCDRSAVVRTTIYLKDMGDFAAVNEVYARYFATEPPARSTIEVARLPRDVLVEIDAIAIAS